MAHRAGSRVLPAMLAGVIVIALVVLFLATWIDTRVRPSPPADPPPATSTPVAIVPPAPAPKPPPSELSRCIADDGRAPVYTSESCPPGTRLDRRIGVAPMSSESPAVRRARERCEAGKQRERIEMARLGSRRSTADLRLWGDYVARECAEYTATAR